MKYSRLELFAFILAIFTLLVSFGAFTYSTRTYALVGGGHLGGASYETITPDVYADGSNTGTTTVAIDPTDSLPNKMAFIVVGWEKIGSAGSIDSVTYDGNACNNIDTQTYIVDPEYGGNALYYCDEADIDDASANVVVTPSSEFYLSVLVKIYYNVAQQAPVDTDKDTGSDDQCDTSVTTSIDGSLVMSGITNDYSTTAQSPDQGDELGTESHFQTTDMGSIIDAVAGVQAFNWSIDTSRDHGCVTAAFSPASS